MKDVKTAAVGDALLWGDVLQTKLRGRVRIKLNDGSLLSLGQNSALRVVKHDLRTQQTALELAYGRIRCRVEKLARSRSSFELRTPTAIAGVIGTDFGADSSNPDETRFVCLSGKVLIRSLDPNVPGEMECKPGEIVVVPRNGSPRPPVKAKPEQLERWQHIAEPGDNSWDHTIPPVREEHVGGPKSPEFPWARQLKKSEQHKK